MIQPNMIQPNIPPPKPASAQTWALLDSYTRIDIVRLEFEKVLHDHDSKDPEKFNDDDTYKSLLNEVHSHHNHSGVCFSVSSCVFSFQVLACKQGLIFKLDAIIIFWC